MLEHRQAFRKKETEPISSNNNVISFRVFAEEGFTLVGDGFNDVVFKMRHHTGEKQKAVLPVAVGKEGMRYWPRCGGSSAFFYLNLAFGSFYVIIDFAVSVFEHMLIVLGGRRNSVPCIEVSRKRTDHITFSYDSVSVCTAISNTTHKDLLSRAQCWIRYSLLQHWLTSHFTAWAQCALTHPRDLKLSATVYSHSRLLLLSSVLRIWKESTHMDVSTVICYLQNAASSRQIRKAKRSFFAMWEEEVEDRRDSSTNIAIAAPCVYPSRHAVTLSGEGDRQVVDRICEISDTPPKEEDTNPRVVGADEVVGLREQLRIERENLKTRYARGVELEEEVAGAQHELAVFAEILQSQNIKKEEETHSLEKQLAFSIQNLETMRVDRMVMAEKMEQLREQVARAKESLEVSHSTALAVKEQIRTLEQQVSMVNEEANALRQNLAGESLLRALHRERVRGFEESMRERSAFVETVEAELLSQRNITTRLEEELTKAHVQVHMYKHGLDERERQSHSHGDQIMASKIVAERLTEEIESGRQKMRSFCVQIEKLKCDRDFGSERVSTLQEEILVLQNQVTQFDETISTLETAASTNVAQRDNALLREEALASKIADAKIAVASVEMQLKEAQDTAHTYAVSIQKMSEKVSAAEVSAKDANQRATVLEMQSRTAVMESIVLQTLLNEEKQARNDTEHELSNMIAEWHAVTLMNTEQERELRRLVIVLDRNDAEITGKDSTLALTICELAAVQDELGNKDTRMKAAAEKASQVQLSLEFTVQRLCAVEHEHATLEQQHLNVQQQRQQESSVSEVVALTLRQALDHANQLLRKCDEKMIYSDQMLKSLHLSGHDFKSKFDEAVHTAQQSAALLEGKKNAIRALECSIMDLEKMSREQDVTVAERNHDLAALQSEMVAKEEHYIWAVSQKDAALALKDKALAEARGIVEKKDEALAMAEEETRTAHASLGANTKNLKTFEDARETALAYAAEEASNMQAALKVNVRNLDILQKEHAQALGQLASRESVVAAKDSELDILENDYEMLKIEYNSCAEKLRLCEETLTRKNAEIVKYSVNSSSLHTKLDEELQALREKKAALEAKDHEIRCLKRSVEVFTKTVSDGEAEVASRSQDLVALRSEMAVGAENHTRAVSEKDAMLASQDQALAEARCIVAKPDEDLAMAADEASRRCLTMKVLRDAIKRNLCDLRTVAIEQMAVVMLSSERCEEQLDAAVLELRHVAAMLEGKEEDIRRLTSSLDEHAHTISKNHQKLSGRDQDLNCLKSEMVAKQGNLARIVSEKDAMLTFKCQELADARCIIEKQNGDLARAAEEISNLTMSLETSTVSLYVLRQDHAEVLGILAGRNSAMAEQVYIYVCMYMYAYVYIHIYILYIYTYTHVYIYRRNRVWSWRRFLKSTSR